MYVFSNLPLSAPTIFCFGGESYCVHLDIRFNFGSVEFVTMLLFCTDFAFVFATKNYIANTLTKLKAVTNLHNTEVGNNRKYLANFINKLAVEVEI